jgi:4-hydroxybenzoate polyprenyltransferase
MNNLTLESPLPTRLKAWMDERFPLINGLLFFALYLTSAALSRFVSQSGPISFSFQDVVGCLMTWSFFLVIRIFDEHKDYELDMQNHPDRVLQQGLITLNHLKVVAYICLVLQIFYSAFLDLGFSDVLRAWFLMFAWTCLMGKEFFCGEWLEKHLTLYAFSHMMVMPLIIWWLVQMGNPGTPLTRESGALMLLAFVSGFAFEITRKTRGPEEERDTVDSYSKIFGPRGAALVVAGLVCLMVFLQGYLLVSVAGWGYWPALIILLVALGLVLLNLGRFISSPSLAGREKNEMTLALSTLVGYLVLIITIYLVRGISIGFWWSV